MTLKRVNIQPEWYRAVTYAQNRLENDLPDALFYHSLTHTRDEVVPFAERLAKMVKLDDESRHLIRVAAFFHDLGFIEQRSGHELVGIQMAKTVLPTFSFHEDQIAAICSMIQATILPQSPVNLLDEIVADADLNVLGQSYFLRRNQDLRREIETVHGEISDKDWYSQQLAFLENHRYFTEAAQSVLDQGKQKNARVLAALVERS